MARAGTIEVILTGSLVGLERALDKAEQRIARSGEKIRQVGTNLTAAITLPLVAIGGVSTKLAVDFDRSMTKIETLVGVQPALVDAWRESLLEMAPAVGRGPGELADALFVVTSAGVRGAGALDILENSAKAAAIGMGETKDIARVTTAAVQAFGGQGLTASRAIEILTATVREGNLEAADLAGSLGRVLGIAAQVGVTFADVGTFVATFTRLGVSAEESVTSLRGVLNSVIKPAEASEAALATVGKSAAILRKEIKTKGLTRTLLDLVDAFKGNVAELALVIPNVRALSGLLGTAGAQAEAFGQISENVSNSLGILDDAFERVRDTPAQSFAEFGAQMQAIAIELGSVLAPALSDILNSFQPVIAIVTRAVRAFADMDEKTQRTIVVTGVLAATLGPLTLAVGLLTTAFAGLLVVTKLGVTGLRRFGAVAAIIGFVVGLLATNFQEAKIEMLLFFTVAVDLMADFVQGIVSLATLIPGISTLFAGEISNLLVSIDKMREGLQAFAGKEIFKAERNIIDAFEGAGDAADALNKEMEAALANLRALLGADLNVPGVTDDTLASTMHDAGVQAGESLLRGFAQGLDNAAEQLRRALVRIATDVIIFSIEDALGIKSPSRVGVRLGLETASGYAMGLMRGAPEIGDALRGSFGLPRLPAAALAGGGIASRDLRSVRSVAMPAGVGGQNFNVQSTVNVTAFDGPSVEQLFRQQRGVLADLMVDALRRSTALQLRVQRGI